MDCEPREVSLRPRMVSLVGFQDAIEQNGLEEMITFQGVQQTMRAHICGFPISPPPLPPPPIRYSDELGSGL